MLICSACDHFRRIILNNPKKRNALSLPMLESLRANILTDLDSEDLRVIIISGKTQNKPLENNHLQTCC